MRLTRFRATRTTMDPASRGMRETFEAAEYDIFLVGDVVFVCDRSADAIAIFLSHGTAYVNGDYAKRRIAELRKSYPETPKPTVK